MSFNVSCDSKLTDFIKIYDGYFPEDLCDDIVHEYKGSSEWSQSRVGTKADLEANTRTSYTLFISDPDSIEINTVKRKKLDERIFNCLGSVIEEYSSTFPYTYVSVDNGYHLLRYTPNQYYREHSDYFPIIGSETSYEYFRSINSRQISCIVTLSAPEKDFLGGGTSFFNDTYRVTASKGTVLMFPSNFMFPHQALPVVSGVRYSLVTWFA